MEYNRIYHTKIKYRWRYVFKGIFGKQAGDVCDTKFQDKTNFIMTIKRSHMDILPMRTCTLTHCRLNLLSHTTYWKSPISILGMSGYEI